ncbi:DUF2461 domain-containing protein [Croceivirga radicis]|uniref:DUF2461 domain-containing protein n=1 Tax=Croceivirga radicis TaxID=1929488 RepID=UPI000255AC4C|nr:DUF2461 domain-containing protein [Croceivirga radicis]
MEKSIITKNTIKFLEDLQENNNRDWFATHKTTFETHKEEAKNFFTAIKSNLEKHDTIERLKMFRIYRDVRFSKDKTPFKAHFAASFSRMGIALRGGYYVRIKPGATFIATGFFGPNKEDLYRIRKEFELDINELKKILEDSHFKALWGKMEGEEVKTAPKGFNKAHPNIEFIKKKQFIFTRKFTDKEVLSNNFIEEIDQSFKTVRPFFDLMSDILTTNLNGESLL